jgi:hypothetical protein
MGCRPPFGGMIQERRGIFDFGFWIFDFKNGRAGGKQGQFPFLAWRGFRRGALVGAGGAPRMFTTHQKRNSPRFPDS